ncbi:MAG: type II secretion system F family protein [Actinomycetota bacterium]|nr:type II secretion system F family protein [Actinomycetota bacterium]
MKPWGIRSLVLAAAALTLVATAPAFAQSAVDIRVREVALDPDGATRLVVSTGALSQPLSADNFAVGEEGEAVADLQVQPLLQSRSQPVFVSVLVDVSGSTAGQALASAKAATKAFVNEVVPRGVAVQLVSFGARAEVETAFTRDQELLGRTIETLEARGETAMYDALVLAADELGRRDGQRNVVVVSDGKDTVSRAKLQDALAALESVKASISSVALVTPDLDRAALDEMARRTGGKSLAVAEAAALSGAFQEFALQLASQYVISYRSSRNEPKELDITVAVAVGDARGEDSLVVANPRVPDAGSRLSVPAPAPLVRGFASSLGLYLGILAAFLALALLLSMAATAPLRGEAEKVLRKGLRLYNRGGTEAPKTSLSTSAVARRAVALAERVPKPEGFDERIQSMLDRAAWPLRTSEFLLLQVGSVLVVALLVGALTGNVVVGLVLGLVGSGIPYALLTQRVHARTSAFLGQLPDTLQLLAGSLRAGYGLLQAVDTVVKEAPDPTSAEFSRVLTEARLGMPLEEALEGMAERLGSEDFRWVVLAINIQRQVGGNLAALLDTVANTLREREQLRRQVKVLTAEGRLSAIILTALPLLLALYMFVMNPEYIMLLFTRFLGLAMVAGAVGLMVVGVVWMRRLVKIDV